MASLLRLFVDNYNELLVTNKDPLVDTWPLMSSPGPVLTILAVYLAFVLKIGPKMMEKRPAFQLKHLMVLYNAFQVIFSIWLASLAIHVDPRNLLTSRCSSSQKLPLEDGDLQTALSRGAWWYFASKITELLDTVLFVLRKKQNQVSFLHVYHHTITALFSWCYLKWLPGEQGLIIGFLNSLVHVFMYTYYMIAALGPEYRKYLWWKKYITKIQLLQFGLILAYLLMTLVMDCKMPKALTYFFCANVIIFMYLFSDFYRKAYKPKKV